MIKDEDFRAMLKVFHGAVKEIVELETSMQRRGVVLEWIEVMGHFDRSLAGIITEKDIEKRRKMVAEFEENLKEFGL